MKESTPGQNVNDLEEVFRRNAQRAYEPVLNRARHPAETSLVVLSFEHLDFGEGHVSSPLIAVTVSSIDLRSHAELMVGPGDLIVLAQDERWASRAETPQLHGRDFDSLSGSVRPLGRRLNPGGFRGQDGQGLHEYVATYNNLCAGGLASSMAP